MKIKRNTNKQIIFTRKTFRQKKDGLQTRYMNQHENSTPNHKE